MGVEIERKFMVGNDGFAPPGDGVRIRQGYLSWDPARTVRVRLAGNRGYLTVKGRTEGASRPEYEYEIPAADAAEMLGTLCERPPVEKVRYRVPHGGKTWEVDVFEGSNAGLRLAEIELDDPEETVAPPSWAGEEVTADPRFQNVNLYLSPFTSWRKD